MQLHNEHLGGRIEALRPKRSRLVPERAKGARTTVTTMDGSIGEELILAGSNFGTAVSVHGADVLGPCHHSPNSDTQLDTVHACIEAQIPGSNSGGARSTVNT
jgi:hypothetical protein